MKNKLYVIMDTILEESGPVFEARNTGIAIRNFVNVMRKQDPTVLYDFELIEVGEFDHSTNTGEFWEINQHIATDSEIEAIVADVEANLKERGK